MVLSRGLLRGLVVAGTGTAEVLMDKKRGTVRTVTAADIGLAVILCPDATGAVGNPDGRGCDGFDTQCSLGNWDAHSRWLP